MKKRKIAFLLCIFIMFSHSVIGVFPHNSSEFSPEKCTLMEANNSFARSNNLDVSMEGYGTISAGASEKRITPNLANYSSIYLAGFDRNRKADGVHDDLWSRCCCIQIGDVTVAFVSVDLIGVMYHEYLQILSDLPDTVQIDLVILSSTHNHEGPDTIGLWGAGLTSGINWDWYQEAMKKISQSITEAYSKLRPAGLIFGHSSAPGFSRDSREPIVMEEQVETLQIIDAENHPITTLIFFASHPEVLWDDNTLITSDYPHYLYQYVEQKTNGSVQLITGPIGGLITPKVAEHTFESAQRYGEDLGNISLSSLQKDSVIWETKITVKSKQILVPMTNPVFRLASLLNLLDRPLYLLRTHLLSAVNVIELGNESNLAQIVTVPGEDFPENWFEIKEKLHAKHRIHIGLCNDELGYIVPIEQFDPTDYEESMSASKYLDPKIHNTLEDMLTIL